MLRQGKSIVLIYNTLALLQVCPLQKEIFIQTSFIHSCWFRFAEVLGITSDVFPY